ncbi:B-cell receptor CD22 [Garra rufa]|uniref:B-cell receptor CD22 n=1 Tax=Garra rufa TaxID=137080 RepID=UPI003CCE8D7A
MTYGTHHVELPMGTLGGLDSEDWNLGNRNLEKLERDRVQNSGDGDLGVIEGVEPGQSVTAPTSKPKLTVKPQSSVFTGDTVTLRCNVDWSTGWTMIWYKDYERIKCGNETEILGDVKVSDGGQYRCSAFKGKRSHTTQSRRVVLRVSERPKAVVRVHPDGRVFRGQSVTLTCDIQETDVSSWNYTWNKNNSVIHVSQSQEYRISSVSESHTGNYSCTGRETQGSRYSHTSDDVTLTVSVHTETLKPHLTVQPEPSQIFRGDTVTLTCGIQGEDWSYMWKCGDEQHNSEEKEIKITVQSKQTCSCYCFRDSLCSEWSDVVTLTVTGSEAPLLTLSVLKLLSFLLAASPYVLVSIILGVKFYRVHVQSDEINQYTVTEE